MRRISENRRLKVFIILQVIYMRSRNLSYDLYHSNNWSEFISQLRRLDEDVSELFKLVGVSREGPLDKFLNRHSEANKAK